MIFVTDRILSFFLQQSPNQNIDFHEHWLQAKNQKKSAILEIPVKFFIYFQYFGNEIIYFQYFGIYIIYCHCEGDQIVYFLNFCLNLLYQHLDVFTVDISKNGLKPGFLNLLYFELSEVGIMYK